MYILSLLILFVFSEENKFCVDLDETDDNFPSGETVPGGRYKNCYKKNGNIIIPDRFTLIAAESFINCSGFVSLTIPKDVTTIERKAFFNCTDLKSIIFKGEKLRMIESSCFENCYQLNNLQLPDSLHDIGESAFMNCISISNDLNLAPALTKILNSTFRNCISIPSISLGANIESIDDYSFYNCTSLSKFTYNNIKSIGDFSFYNCVSLSEINLEQITDSIGQNSFSNCKKLTGNLQFSDTLKSIGNNAFDGCSQLNGILHLSDSIVTIGSRCFYGAKNLKGSINLPIVEFIGESAFEGCESLTGSIEIGDICKTIGKRAFFQCSGFKGLLVLSNNLTILEESTFFGCSGLTGTLVIPSDVTSIGKNCFKGCSSLSKLEFGPDSKLDKLYESSFESCSGFKGDLEIPNSVTEIFENTFAYCTGFTGILLLNNSIMTIHDEAFIGCSSFSQLNFSSDSNMKIGNRAFLNCKGFNGPLILPNGVSEIGVSAFEYCSGFEKLVPSPSLKIVGEKAFYCCSGFKGVFNFSLSYTEFCNEAFCGCSGFTGNLVLRDIIYHEYVFANCSGFTSIDLQTNKVTNLNKGTFKGCIGIKDVKLAPKSIVHSYAFEGCTQINDINIDDVSLFYPYVFVNCVNLKGPIRFSDSIENISEGLFYNCYSIKSIEIGENIKNIEQKAFYNCTSLSGSLVLPFNIESINEESFYKTNITEIIYYPPMPPAICASNSFSNKPKLTLSEIYIYADFCGIPFDKNHDENSPIEIQPSNPANESFGNVEISGGDSESIAKKIEKAFEELRKSHKNTIKIVVVDPGVFDFTSKLESDEYIKVIDQSNMIYYKKGNLNIILDPDLPVNNKYDDPNIIKNLSCKGNGKLTFHSSQKSSTLIFDKTIDINGTIDIEFDPVSDTIIFKTVNLSNSGVFKKLKEKTVINDLYVAPYTNFSFDDVIFNNSIIIEQTATLEFNEDVEIDNAIINYKIHGFSPSNPILKGHFHSVPKKLILNKLKNDKPNTQNNYIVVSGWFYNSSCTEWLKKVDFGNSSFNEKYCHELNLTLNANVLSGKNDEEVYQSLVVKYNRDLDEKTAGSNKTAMIVGIVVGCVVFVAIIIVVVILVIKHKKKQQVSNSS